VDREHKEIFDLLIALWGADPPSRESVLDIVISHLTDHFEGEETLFPMLFLTPEEIEKHKEEHFKLQEFLFSLKDSLALEEEEHLGIITVYIQEQLIPHIVNCDKLMARKTS
jgi:hemerythrin